MSLVEKVARVLLVEQEALEVAQEVLSQRLSHEGKLNGLGLFKDLLNFLLLCAQPQHPAFLRIALLLELMILCHEGAPLVLLNVGSYARCLVECLQVILKAEVGAGVLQVLVVGVLLRELRVVHLRGINEVDSFFVADLSEFVALRVQLLYHC